MRLLLPPDKYLLFLRLFLCFILPAVLSTNSLQNGNVEDIVAWLKYFVVISFGLVLELVLDQLNIIPYSHKTYQLLKFGLILWCLAPTQYNGSDLTYTNVVAPVFEVTKQAVQYIIHTTPIVLETSLEYTLTFFEISLECLKLGGEYSVNAAMIVTEKIIELSYMTAGYCKLFAEYCINYTAVILGGIGQYSVELYHIIMFLLEVIIGELYTLMSFLTKTLIVIVEGLGEYSKAVARSSKGAALDLVTKIRSTGENYRIMSGILIQLIRGTKETEQHERTFSNLIKQYSWL